MSVLTRYILAEILKVLTVTLMAMTLMWLILVVMKEAVSQGLGPVQVMQLLPYLLPDSLRFTVPGTILFAACSVYGRMSADNEIVATKAAGIHPWHLFVPIVVVATLLSLTTVWLNDVAVSWGRMGARRVVVESVDKIAYDMLATQRSYTSEKISINVKRVDGKTLVQPTISMRSKDDGPPITIRAAEAELRLDRENQELIFACRDGTLDFGGRGTLEFPDTIERGVPLEDASRAKGDARHPSWMSLTNIPSEIDDQIHQIEEHDQMLAAKAAFWMFTGEMEGLTSHEWFADVGHHRGLVELLHRLRLEPQRRWSTGFSCLAFILVGAPMSVRRRNANVWSTFFTVFFPILLVYYPLLILAVDLGKTGRMPPYSLWVGNAILAAWGIWLWRGVKRY